MIFMYTLYDYTIRRNNYEFLGGLGVLVADPTPLRFGDFVLTGRFAVASLLEVKAER
jgi:hypothetical protein